MLCVVATGATLIDKASPLILGSCIHLCFPQTVFSLLKFCKIAPLCVATDHLQTASFD